MPRARYVRSTGALWLAWIISLGASAAETDQFLAWETELRDCAEPFNRYLNDEITVFLDKMNQRIPRVKTAEALTQRLYQHLFQGLFSSRLRKWLNTSPKIDRYPDHPVSMGDYRKQSIFQKPIFPYILPMFRTIRVGEVHFGLDKIGHFFGYGRRYHQRYLRMLEEGAAEDEAVERVVRWGFSSEMLLVGKLMDGVFSHADLEANFQGFILARDFCEGPDPYFVNEDGKWRLTRKIDLRKYITPDFDESYNVPTFSRLRQRKVAPVLLEKYEGFYQRPEVQARFAAYRARGEASFSKRFVDALLAERGRDAKKEFPLPAATPPHPPPEPAGR